MSSVINQIIFAVAAMIVLFLLLFVAVLPFFVRYSQTFVMYRNRFNINTDVYQSFYKNISFYNSILLTIQLYRLQETT